MRRTIVVAFALFTFALALRSPSRAQSSSPPQPVPATLTPVPTLAVPTIIHGGGIVGGFPLPTTNGAPSLAVTGHGYVVRIPDRATVSIYLQTAGSSSDAALAAATGATAGLQKSLEHVRGARVTVNSSNLSYSAATYNVATNIEVTLDDLAAIDDLKKMLGSIAGAQLGQIRFDVRDRAAASAEAIGAALADARSQVDTLTGKSGLKVTGVRSMQVFVGNNAGFDRTAVRIDATASAMYEVAVQ